MPPSRKSGFITFAAFHSRAKLSGAVLRAWAQILHRTKRTRLLLQCWETGDPTVAQELEDLFRAENLDPGRVEVLPPSDDRRTHLALYNRADIALNTFPYHGVTTTCEALWMGLPVLTLIGEGAASRMGASILSAVGLHQWIATSWEEYVQLAVDASSQLEMVAILRKGLRSRMKNSALMDTKQYAAYWESAFLRMWSEFN